jgi:hypothetical protein
MDKRQIFILGSQNYQNEILAHYLEHERGIECRILPPDGVLDSGRAETNEGTSLFLIDCSEAGVERYFVHPQLNGDRPPSSTPSRSSMPVVTAE